MDSYSNPAYPGASANQPASNRPRSPSRLPLLLLLLLGVIVLAFLPALWGQIEYNRTKKEVQALQESLPALNLRSLSKAFTLVYRKVKPSVVHIDTKRALNAGGSAFSPFFNRPRSYEEQGEASGFVVDPAGYLLTNLHVVEYATEVNVTFDDGRAFPADVLGVDPAFDLAVLKIDAKDLIPITWGDSDKLDVGEMVWAIGNPFGLDQTITSGIVSAKGRREMERNGMQEFLQTDVPINPGSSGGPLVDVNGDVVGVNTAIFGPTYQGISFAIPSNKAKEVYDQIRANKKVIYGYLGAGSESVAQARAERVPLPADRTTGAVIQVVVRGSPAEKAGLEPGDLIVAWNGQPVTDPNQLQMLVAGTEVGGQVPINLIRDGKELTLQVGVIARPAQQLIQEQKAQPSQ